MCSNVEIAKTATGYLPNTSPNYVFCEELIEWNFGESGIIKAENPIHRKADGSEVMPGEYPINTPIEYQIDLFEWSKKEGKWRAFDNADAQIEFAMIDPYYRVPLIQVKKGEPTYKTAFTTPDRLGVFQFKLNYTRNGYTTVEVSTKVQRYFPHV